MLEIKESIKIICFCGVFIAVINSIVIDKQRSKLVGIVSGLIFILILLKPIIKNDYNLESFVIDNNKEEIRKEMFTDELLMQTQLNIAKALSTALTNEECGVEGIKVECEFDENYNININKIECIITDEAMLDKATGIVKEKVGECGCLRIKSKTN